MGIIAVRMRLLVLHAAGRHIDFTADDRLQPPGNCLLIKFHHAIHDTMIRNGHSGHSQLLAPVQQLRYSACPIQQAVFGMHMQMHKVRHLITFIPHGHFFISLTASIPLAISAFS